MVNAALLHNLAIAHPWIPNQSAIEHTHIHDLQTQLQLNSYNALHQWSVAHRGSFWQLMLQRLNIRLQKPYRQILDCSQGVEQARWLVGGRLNIVESCFNAPPTATAIVYQAVGEPLHRWTYDALEKLTNRVANGLVEKGFKPGDAIALYLPMTAESVAIYLGIIKMGGVVVAIADSFAPAEIRLRLQIAHTKAIFTQDVVWRRGKLHPLYAKIIESKAPQAIVLNSQQSGSARSSSVGFNSVGFGQPHLRNQDLTWQSFLSDNDSFQAVGRAPDDPTNILFSSGTTGPPKAIPWTQTTPIKCAADGHLHHDIHANEIVAWPTNLGWMMGPWLIYASLINQATIALYYDAPSDRGFGEFVQNARVNLLGVVPSLVRSWKQSQCMQGLDWSSVKAFSSTGECSNAEDMAFLMDLAGHKPVIEYCGGTEIGGGYLTGTLVQPALPAAFTTPTLGLNIAILDNAGRPSSEGEAFIIPPSIGLSSKLLNRDHHRVYFEGTPAYEVPLRRHGDRIQQFTHAHHTYYRAQGRVDDTMNLGGIKVSAAEIERVLLTVEGIEEVAAIAVSPPSGGPSQLVVYAVSEQKRDRLLPQLQITLRQQLNPLFKIHDLKVVNTLPRTASNKVMRRQLREHYSR